MKQGEARDRVVSEARAMGERDGAAGRPPLTAQYSGAYIVGRAALGGGVGPLRAGDAEAWAPAAVSSYSSGHAEAQARRSGVVNVPRREGRPGTSTALARVLGGDALPDSDQWRNRIEIRSETSSRVYVVAQRMSTGEWACSCLGWKRHRHCKHLSAIVPVLGQGGPS